MASKIISSYATSVFSDIDTTPVPGDKSQLAKWFNGIVGPLSQRMNSLDPTLVAAEKGAYVLRVMQDGSGNFKTVKDAIKSIPSGNTKRVIVYIGGGTYTEKIKIDKTKPFVTLYGEPGSMPNLTFNDTAEQTHGTYASASLFVESDYFVAANIIITNSAPYQHGKANTQAVALRISGNRAAFYGCTMIGYQDTLLDDSGKHFFKDCTIRGTVDFIFGGGKSIYLNTTLNVVEMDKGVIAAQARTNDSDDTGFSFVYCEISGTANGTYLGRAWRSHPKVVYAYTTMSPIVNPLGWDDGPNGTPTTVNYGEYKNNGAGANGKGRASFTKWLSDSEAYPFINLGYIEASKWLLPPPSLKI